MYTSYIRELFAKNKTWKTNKEDIRYLYEGIIVTIPEENVFTVFAEPSVKLDLRLSNVKLGEEWCRKCEYDSEAERVLIRKMYNVDNPEEVYYCATYT